MHDNIDSIAIRNQAALELMRFKVLKEVAEGSRYPGLTIADVNEILTVAGMPVIIPEEVNAPELKVIKPEREIDPLDFGEEAADVTF